MSEVIDSKYRKLRKRVKVAVGRSQNSLDVVESGNLDSKKKGVGGSNEKGGSRRVVDDSVPNTSDGQPKREDAVRRVRLRTESEDSRRRGQRVEPSRVGVRKYEKMQHRSGSEVDGVSYRKENFKKREYSDRKSVASNAKDSRIRGGKVRDEAVSYGNNELKPENYDRKRKRIYADRDTDGKSSFQKKTPSRDDFSRAGPNKCKDDIAEDNRTRRGASCDSEKSSWKKTPVRRRQPNEDDSVDAIVEDRQIRRGELWYSEQSRRKKSVVERRKNNHDELSDEKGGRNLIFSGKDISKVKIVERGDSAYIPPKKFANRTFDSSEQLNRRQKKIAAESPQQSAKKKIQFKKCLGEDSATTDSRPKKKKKRVMRIDPHDFSNKRLEDGTATPDDTKEKKEDSDSKKNAEMSMNAQFRAIQASPSILSFVEENLLGRRREIEFRNAGYNIELPVPLDNIPSSESSERARIDEAVFRNKLEFFAAAKISSSFPPPDLAEIAFAGRSNVGKSSLLNALTRQWGVARTSDKPGLTQTINFFKLGPKISLVDLPGYGFAYAKEEAKEAWEELVKEYVSTRVGLKRVCLLIDTKWGMKQRDYELIDLMEKSKTKYQVILTKTDLSFPIDVARRAMQIEESLVRRKSAVQPVMMVSSRTGGGIRSLRNVLAKVARFVKL